MGGGSQGPPPFFEALAPAPKRVHFDRLEITWIPDGGTAAAALRTGEIDWIEYPLPDLVPVLDRDRNTRTQIYDPTGFLGFLRFNHLHAPFNDVRVRRAIRDVLVQSDYMSAVALPGDWQECHAMFPCGLPGTLEFPAVTQQGRVTVALMRRLGVNIQAFEIGRAGVIARRSSRAPPAAGGWHLHNTNFPSPGIANPALSPIIRMHGEARGSAGPPMPGSRPRSRPGSRRRMRPRKRRRCSACNAWPGRRCPSRRPGCSACAPPSGGNWRARCGRHRRCCGTCG